MSTTSVGTTVQEDRLRADSTSAFHNRTCRRRKLSAQEIETTWLLLIADVVHLIRRVFSTVRFHVPRSHISVFSLLSGPT